MNVKQKAMKFDKETIIDIAKYNGINEVPCRSCGSINDIENTIIRHEAKRIRCSCPDCGTFVRWLPMSKTERIFYKGQYDEVASFDSGLLQWFLKVGYCKNLKTIRAIEAELASRVAKSAQRPPSEHVDREEQAILDKKNAIQAQIDEVNKKIAEKQKEIVENSQNFDYFETKIATNAMQEYRATKKKLEKELKIVQESENRTF